MFECGCCYNTAWDSHSYSTNMGKQYEKDPDSIFEKRRKTGRPRILHEEHKSVIIECIDENPSVVLNEVMEKLKQIFTELKVSTVTQSIDPKLLYFGQIANISEIG